MPLLPQGRRAGLPPEGGDGRAAGRRQAAHASRQAHGRRQDPEPPDRLLPRPRQPVPADALQVLRGDRRGDRRSEQRQGGRPRGRGHPLVALPVPRHPGGHRRVDDGGQSLPSAEDPLLDAHHRIEPGALRAARGGAQRAAAAGRGAHRRHRHLPARRHPVPERRHPSHLLRRQAAPAHAARVLQRSGRRGRAAHGLHRHRRDLRTARLPAALSAQAAPRGVVEPDGRLQPRRGALLGDPRPLGSGAVPLRQRPGGGAGRGAVGTRSSRGARRPPPAACRRAARGGPAGAGRGLPRPAPDADPGRACRAARRRRDGRSGGRRLRRRRRARGATPTGAAWP